MSKVFLTWDEVKIKHGTVGAVSISLDKSYISSLLCGSDTYSDEINDNFIHYSIPNRKFYLKSLNLLSNQKKNNMPLRVFRKFSKNCWSDEGFFTVFNIETNDKLHKVILSKTP
jgi:hypothetical protein